MKTLDTLPKEDGFYMPAEFSPHHGTIMIYPERSGSWRYGGKKAIPAFRQIWDAITEDEELYLIVSEAKFQKASSYLKNNRHAHILTIPQNDAWARDTAPTFVKDKGGNVRGIDWKFNAWGGDFDGLYADYEEDNKLATEVCRILRYDCYHAEDFVLEGGSIHSDGEGTILVTESCLLSQGRNPQMTKEQITQTLCNYLGAEKVVWLPRGIYNDETNEHVDNICAFLNPAEVVLAWTDNQNDPQYALSLDAWELLHSETDAKGRKFTVHPLPIPVYPVCVTAHDLEGLEFAEGEDNREVGERLAASYVNFYFTNHSVLVPQFGGENAVSDALAVQMLQEWCPNRKVVPIPAKELILGGGNIHCLTQQIPK